MLKATVPLPAFILLLSGCALTGMTTVQLMPEENGSVSAEFCPEAGCYGTFIEFINSSQEVSCALYSADDELIALNSSTKQMLLHHKSSRGLMHNKFCVSNDVVLTGSFNPLKKSISFDNVVMINSSTLAANYREEFFELQNKGKNRKTRNTKVMLSGKLIENYFCPDDDCLRRIIEELSRANSTVKFMAYSFTDPEIASELAAKRSEGIEIRGMFEKSGNNKYSKHDFLELQGISVKWFQKPGNLHHKVFIIDNKTVITGSMNPTKAGNEKNDENILIIHDETIARQFLEEFERLWSD